MSGRLVRRTLLGLSLLLVGIYCGATAGAPTDPPILVTVGEVTERSAALWMWSSRPGPYTVTYSVTSDLTDAQLSRIVHAEPSRDDTARHRLDSLAPGTRYFYSVNQGEVSVSGQFVTAPNLSERRPVVFLWSGDLGLNLCRDPRQGYPIFAPMARMKPDFFLFVGDTIYADARCKASENVPGADFSARRLPQFWAKHLYNRSDPILQQFFRTTSVYAIWDDHEVKNDFAGPNEPLMPVGRQAFFDYWPIMGPPEEPTRFYRKFQWGGLAEIFILDARQYRSAETEPDRPSKTMLGAAQKRWFVDAVLRSTAVWKIVVSTVPLSYPTHDGWARRTGKTPEQSSPGFETELTAILKQFRDQKVGNLVWLTADIHQAQAIRYTPWPDFTTYEFTAGPLSATTGLPRPLSPTLSPTTLFARGGFLNFGRVDLDQSGLTVRFIDLTGASQFEHTIRPE